MTDATRPKTVRSKMLPAGILAAAVFALLAFAPLASAASNPVAPSGSTTVTLNSGFTKYLKTFGIKVSKVNPAKLKGAKATFPITGGSLTPAGVGTVSHSGGLKFKAGKKSATVKNLVIDTSKKSLTGKVGGKKVKVASLTGLKATANGFGTNLSVKSFKLTGASASALNKALGFAKGKPKPFIGGKVLGKGASETQPSTVTLIAGTNLGLATAEPTIKKLLDVGVKIEALTPTSIFDPTPTHPGYNFPITGGTVAPTFTAGTVQSAGGLKLIQDFGTVKTEITLANFYYDLGAKTASVEVTATSNADPKLNLGALGRSSIADVSLTGATTSANPATHTVSVLNAPATVQPVAAEVLDAFRKVAEGGAIKQLIEGGKTKAEAEALAAAKFAGDHIVAGDPLGAMSFTAQTE